MVFDKIKRAFSSPRENEPLDEEYLEIDLDKGNQENKISVKLFTLKQYDDVTRVLNALREGYTIAVIDTKTLRQRDPIELKRVISKIKKTIEALDGSIVGFKENMVIATPSFAKVDKEPEIQGKKDNKDQKKKDY